MSGWEVRPAEPGDYPPMTERLPYLETLERRLGALDTELALESAAIPGTSFEAGAIRGAYAQARRDLRFALESVQETTKAVRKGIQDGLA